MAKRKTAAAPTTVESDWGALAHLPQGTLRSCTIGALPILNHFFQRMHLEDILDAHLPHRSEEHTSELQSLRHLVCRLLLEKNNQKLKAANTPLIPLVSAKHNSTIKQ